eukprot:GCRY01004502.1.p1 GENE.GCRY01004502.1~~GCRY01004502.1.p1  ORF type:complete len:426 (+),score=53.44 GCRY01004502.1:110-1387(+)
MNLFHHTFVLRWKAFFQKTCHQKYPGCFSHPFCRRISCDLTKAGHSSNNLPYNVKYEDNCGGYSWLSPPTSILLSAKPNDDFAYSWVRTLSRWLLENFNVQPFLEPSSFVSHSSQILSKINPPIWNGEKIDLAVTLGGDGTLLNISSLFPQQAPPVVSFALGSLGFLTPYEVHSFRQVLTSILCAQGGHPSSSCASLQNNESSSIRPSTCCSLLASGKNEKPENDDKKDFPFQLYQPLPLLPRMRLTVKLIRPSCRQDQNKTSSRSLINEVFLGRASSCEPVVVDMRVDGLQVTTAMADGIILATPTGTTAYTLSAGGPLVHHSSRSIVVTPVAPHSFSFRPVVLPESSVVELELSPRSRSEGVMVSVDGQSSLPFYPGDILRTQQSSNPIFTVDQTVGAGEWLRHVSKKLHWNYHPHAHTHSPT